MKTIKTSQVSASLLNRIVASINGHSIVNSDLYGVEVLALSGNLEVALDFCANWSDAGPILEADSQERTNATVAKIQSVANRVNAAIVALKKKYRIIF